MPQKRDILFFPRMLNRIKTSVRIKNSPYYNFTLIYLLYGYRFSFLRSSIKSRSWLAMQPKRYFCAYLRHVQGQVGEDISQLQTCCYCRRCATGFQVWLVPEEENRNREPLSPEARSLLRSSSVRGISFSHQINASIDNGTWFEPKKWLIVGYISIH